MLLEIRECLQSRIIRVMCGERSNAEIQDDVRAEDGQQKRADDHESLNHASHLPFTTEVRPKYRSSSMLSMYNQWRFGIR